MQFCIVGAGFSGAVLARHLADQGHKILVLDERAHIGGNCHTSRDERSGVMVHHYGPHIFHTQHQHVWDYVCRFGRFRPYINRVKAISQKRVYSLPINLLTINQFFNIMMGPEEARAFIAQKADKTLTHPANFEEQALSMIGPELYRAFFEGYTRKQWGMAPTDLPASILKRLPVRFNYDDNYFNHPWQGIPEEGYTEIIANILGAEGITLKLDTSFERFSPRMQDFDHIFYTGPLDRYFNFSLGRLPYRTLDFERFEAEGDYQGAAVINYCDAEIPWTRIAEHKHFAPWEADRLERTLCFREYSRQAEPGDTPYYPIRLAHESAMLKAYIALARRTSGISFLGRLGTYRYLDMDTSIAEALEACAIIDARLAERQPLPGFFIDPS